MKPIDPRQHGRAAFSGAAGASLGNPFFKDANQ
jgi:hypothetical protein